MNEQLKELLLDPLHRVDNKLHAMLRNPKYADKYDHIHETRLELHNAIYGIEQVLK
jgi:hypothetical protein